MLVEEERPLADAAERHVTRWIEAHVGGKVLRIVRQGRWRPAWHVDVERDGCTLELYVRGERVENFLPYSLEREFGIWRLLEAGGLRVPHVHGLIEELPGIVMDRVAGRSNLATADSAEDVEAVRRQLAAQMVQMHRLDIAPFVAAGLRLPDSPRALTLSQFDDILARYKAERRRADPLVAFAARWIERNAPSSARPACYTACDAGQFLFDGAELTALMDFELSVIGDPMMDLAALRIRGQWEDLGDIPSFYALYEAAGGWPVDLPAIRFHTAAFALAGTMASCLCMEQFLAAPQPDADYVEYLVWIVWEAKQALEAIAECIGVTLEPPAPPPVHHGWADAPIFAIASMVGELSEADPVAAYRKNVQRSLTAYLERIALYGPKLEADYLADVARMTGAAPADVAEADRLLEAFVDAAGPEADEALLRLLHANVCRRAFLLAVPGSLYLNGLVRPLLPV
ncbi:phosphotransferase [Sphingomonas montanisoli]|uniref:Phosphotransferase n=1 Tax=Sphingomonas montanisoli TaxID=2606412 RepID=A0A5D9CCL6_9SPHN|nr:phosphotransferase [Sphingomonas montanisoli]TZG27881.1 phosphotransferase [Sphingomonas montanisoli]